MGRLGGSPGLVVMGDDSCSKGRGFESWRQILDGLIISKSRKKKKKRKKDGPV